MTDYVDVITGEYVDADQPYTPFAVYPEPRARGDPLLHVPTVDPYKRGAHTACGIDVDESDDVGNLTVMRRNIDEKFTFCFDCCPYNDFTKIRDVQPEGPL